MRAARRFKTFVRDESGASALEFAMTLPAFVMLVLGTMQLGYAFFCGSTLQYALEKVARNVMVDSTMTQSTAQSQFDSVLKSMNGPHATLSYTVDTSGAVPIARLTATYKHNVVIPLVPAFSLTFTADTSVPQP